MADDTQQQINAGMNEILAAIKFLSIAQNTEGYRPQYDAFERATKDKNIVWSLTNDEFKAELLAFKAGFEKYLFDHPEEERAIKNAGLDQTSKTDQEFVEQLVQVSQERDRKIEKTAETRANKFLDDLTASFGKQIREEARKKAVEIAKQEAKGLADNINKPLNLQRDAPTRLREGFEKDPELAVLLADNKAQQALAYVGQELEQTIRATREAEVVQVALTAPEATQSKEYIQILSAYSLKEPNRSPAVFAKRAATLSRVVEGYGATPDIPLTGAAAASISTSGIARSVATPIGKLVDNILGPEASQVFTGKILEKQLNHVVEHINQINEKTGTTIAGSEIFRNALDKAKLTQQTQTTIGSTIAGAAADLVNTVVRGPTTAEELQQLESLRHHGGPSLGRTTQNKPLEGAFVLMHYPAQPDVFVFQPISEAGGTVAHISSNFLQSGIQKFFKKLFGGAGKSAAKGAAGAAGKAAAKEGGKRIAKWATSKILVTLLKFVSGAVTGGVGWIVSAGLSIAGWLAGKAKNFVGSSGGLQKVMSALNRALFGERGAAAAQVKNDPATQAACVGTCGVLGCFPLIALLVVPVYLGSLFTNFGGGGEPTGPVNYGGPQASGPLQCLNYNVSDRPFSQAQVSITQSAIAAYPQIGLYNCLLQCPQRQINMHAMGYKSSSGYWGWSPNEGDLYFYDGYFQASTLGQARLMAHELGHQLNAVRPDIFSAFMNGSTQYPRGYCGCLGTYHFGEKLSNGCYSGETPGETFAEAAAMYLVGQNLQALCPSAYNFMSRVFNQCAAQ